VLRPLLHSGLRLLRLVLRFKWTAEGLGRLERTQLPVIFAANHCSHADTAAIMGTLPRKLRKRTCVAAALDVFGPVNDARTVRVVRRECLQAIVAAGFHAFAFDRYGPPLRSLRTAVELVQRDWCLLLYPEGTRSRTGRMSEFKPGIGVLAKATGRPVIPVYVSGGNSILPCGCNIPRPGHAVVRYGVPLTFEAGETVQEFTRRLQQQVRALAPEGEPSAHVRDSAPPAKARFASLSRRDY
jgi:long-chain acyl-CoA synthetase